MLIPIGTDAPTHHWPITTAILIFVNICVFVLQSAVGENYDWSADHSEPRAARIVSLQDFDELGLDRNRPANGPGRQDNGADNEWDFEFDQREFQDPEIAKEFEEALEEWAESLMPDKDKGWQPYALWIGDGIHPLQWVTSFFMHVDLLHLIGNMIFLMMFGLVVESRLGNWQFAVYYLALGTFGSMVTQILTLWADENIALGASGAIYGVMVTASLWWPRFSVICVWIIWFYAFFPRIPILIFGVFYVLWDVGTMLFGARLIDSAFLHVIGAFSGTVFATMALWRRWVDTEYEDFYSILLEAAGKNPKKRKPKPLTKKERLQREEESRQREFEKSAKLERIWKSVDAHLAANNLDAAIMMERQARQIDSNSGWDEARLLKLIGKLQAAQDWDKVILHSEIYLKKFKSRSTTIRLNVAKILMLHKQMPRKALKLVKPLETVELDEKQTKTLQQIVLKGKRLIDTGTLEYGE
jgi:membrane associated rhomboid family serine protease